MSAYYNEYDKHAAQWLRNLIAAGHIAPGVVDERSILEVSPDDLRGYKQCHFFAGIGGWSYALRLARWPDDRPVWTGSCPCQPFSAAGKQRGSNDERHLWPAFFDLIRKCRPGAVFGEQVAGAAGYAWWDHVAADLEGEGYAAAAADIGAHSVGAPHLRQRLYWVADAGSGRREQHGLALAAAPRGSESQGHQRQRLRVDAGDGCVAGRMADMQIERCGQGSSDASRGDEGVMSQGAGLRPSDDCGCVMGHADTLGSSGCGDTGRGERVGQPWAQPAGAGADGVALGDATEPGPQGRDEPGQRVDAQHEAAERAGSLDAWADIEWLQCSDGKARPTQSGLFPLAHGVSGRVGLLRGYGNAIVPQVAAAFVMAASA